MSRILGAGALVAMVSCAPFALEFSGDEGGGGVLGTAGAGGSSADAGAASVGGSGGALACAPGQIGCDGSWRRACADGELVHVENCADLGEGICLDGACEQSLVARWAFEEGSGDVVVDDVGGLVGTLENGSWAPGAIGGGIYLTGGSRVALGDVLNEPLPVSLTAWVTVSEAAAAFAGSMVVIALDDAAGYAGTWLSVAPMAGNVVSAGIGDATGTSSSDRNGKTSTSGFQPETWTHVAVVVQAPGDMDLFIDGQLVDGQYGGTATSATYTSAPASVGSASWGNGNFQFYGSLDEVRVYRRALNPSDVQRIASRR